VHVIKLMAAALVLAAGCASSSEKEEPVTKVLMIGNSFSISTLTHLPKVAANLQCDLDLTSLYIGGCSLQRHWENADRDGDKSFKPYRYDRVVKGERKVEAGRINVLEALRREKYDIVTIQQASHLSWKPESFHPWGDMLVEKIRVLQPQAKIFVQETWSYTPWDKRLKKWNIDQNEMYAKLKESYAAFADKYGFPLIRMGAAVQAWRERLPVRYTENSFGGDVVGGGGQDVKDHFKRTAENRWVPNGDVFHLGRRGEYLQALVWAAKLFDADVTGCTYRPDYVTEKEAKLMAEIATELR